MSIRRRFLRALLWSIETILLLEQGWQLKRMKQSSLHLRNRWFWKDPETGSWWLRSAALIICEWRLSRPNSRVTVKYVTTKPSEAQTR